MTDENQCRAPLHWKRPRRAASLGLDLEADGAKRQRLAAAMDVRRELLLAGVDELELDGEPDPRPPRLARADARSLAGPLRTRKPPNPPRRRRGSTALRPAQPGRARARAVAAQQRRAGVRARPASARAPSSRARSPRRLRARRALVQRPKELLEHAHARGRRAGGEHRGRARPSARCAWSAAACAPSSTASSARRVAHFGVVRHVLLARTERGRGPSPCSAPASVRHAPRGRAAPVAVSARHPGARAHADSMPPIAPPNCASIVPDWTAYLRRRAERETQHGARSVVVKRPRPPARFRGGAALRAQPLRQRRALQRQRHGAKRRRRRRAARRGRAGLADANDVACVS